MNGHIPQEYGIQMSNVVKFDTASLLLITLFHNIQVDWVLAFLKDALLLRNFLMAAVELELLWKLMVSGYVYWLLQFLHRLLLKSHVKHNKRNMYVNFGFFLLIYSKLQLFWLETTHRRKSICHVWSKNL